MSKNKNAESLVKAVEEVKNIKVKAPKQFIESPAVQNLKRILESKENPSEEDRKLVYGFLSQGISYNRTTEREILVGLSLTEEERELLYLMIDRFAPEQENSYNNRIPRKEKIILNLYGVIDSELESNKAPNPEVFYNDAGENHKGRKYTNLPNNELFISKQFIMTLSIRLALKSILRTLTRI